MQGEETAERLCADGDRLLRSGQLAAAEQKYRRALTLNDRNYGAHNALGLIALEGNRLEDAIVHLQRACAIRPFEVTPHVNLANALARGGRFSNAVAVYDDALRLAPNDPGISCSRSNALLYAGRTDEAIECYQRILRHFPDDRNTLLSLAAATLRLGRYGDCANYCMLLLAKTPGDLDVLLMWLAALNGARRLDDAIVPMRRALDLTSSLLSRGKHAPEGLPQRILRLAQLLADLEEADEALRLLETARQVFPDVAALHDAHGRALVRLMRHGEAISSFDRALALDVNSSDALIDRATTLAQLGRFDAAIADCDRALDFAAAAPGALIELVGFKTFRHSDDPHLKRIEELAVRSDGLGTEDRIYVHFSAGKAYDDLGRYDEAFEHLQVANRLKRQSIVYDVRSDVAFAGDIAGAFNQSWLEGHVGRGSNDATPVFVFGMPRSGTTLVEQLIAAHPDAAAIGETGFLQRAVRQSLRMINGQSSIERTKALDGTSLARLGESYLAMMRERSRSHSQRIVDKTLSNSQYAGFIAAALPNATMIHVRRDARDNCLACYAKHFVSGNNFTYDLDDLAQYRRAHDRLMEHWRSVLPRDKFLEVDYEALVGNFAAEAQRIVAFCGLSWNDAVLDFARVSRPVATASAFQVRQGLYSTSVGRWRNYEKRLAPLLNALEFQETCVAAAR